LVSSFTERFPTWFASQSSREKVGKLTALHAEIARWAAHIPVAPQYPQGSPDVGEPSGNGHDRRSARHFVESLP
jgi:hypothetical protein